MTEPDTTTLDGFLATYAPDGYREVVDRTIEEPQEGEDTHHPFFVVRHGKYVAVITTMALGSHLCLDVHAFVDGKDATAGVFGMTNGARATLEKTDTTSHGWPSAAMLAVLVGEQGVPLDPKAGQS
jgi:hypothetical protein